MRKGLLALLFTIVASMVFAVDYAALAQESSDSMESEMMEDTMEDTMADETAEETMTDETATIEDTMEATVLESAVLPPLMQLTMGVDPHEIECIAGQVLVFRATNWQPACINESSFSVLSERGWVADHDPSHEDLMKMVDEHMAKQDVEVPDEEVPDEAPPEENDGNAGVNGTDTEPEPEPQSYTIDLREDMEMGAN